jgi:hypothetical protein
MIWKNKNFFHTVTAQDGSFDCGNIAPDGAWKVTARAKDTLLIVSSS